MSTWQLAFRLYALLRLTLYLSTCFFVYPLVISSDVSSGLLRTSLVFSSLLLSTPSSLLDQGKLLVWNPELDLGGLLVLELLLDSSPF
eukprot:TRINITY_DN10015_c0_g2_i1.p2 TRINITY_DN10015_c0_g2~~TRINITY_DN10015_c0_g2_i1.p2  ORF type:complete len:88 (-),score=2.33 TRINITY_DN10015_c0_g2_i1:300-563(-)